MNRKWIFFDLGWTLVDETEAHRSRLAETSTLLADFGKAYSVDQLFSLTEQAASNFAPSPFRGMLEQLDLSDSQIAEIKSSVHYANEKERIYPCVPEVLRALSEHFQLGIIANQSAGAETRLAHWGIRQYFSFVFASAELGLSKPNPEIFIAALSKARCRPEEAVMVGDRIDNDIVPAKAQGLATIRILQGFSRLCAPRGPDEEPDATVHTIGEILVGQRLIKTSGNVQKR